MRSNKLLRHLMAAASTVAAGVSVAALAADPGQAPSIEDAYLRQWNALTYDKRPRLPFPASITGCSRMAVSARPRRRRLPTKRPAFLAS